ncbi:MAG: hypothetical protein KAX24_10520, partial [Anaerolineae bacterium]|nr:hypothetical protein [Anaerolineae bacterium]
MKAVSGLKPAAFHGSFVVLICEIRPLRLSGHFLKQDLHECFNQLCGTAAHQPRLSPCLLKKMGR